MLSNPSATSVRVGTEGSFHACTITCWQFVACVSLLLWQTREHARLRVCPVPEQNAISAAVSARYGLDWTVTILDNSQPQGKFYHGFVGEGREPWAGLELVLRQHDPASDTHLSGIEGHAFHDGKTYL